MADRDFLRLRRRSGWEASDAGILLWRRNAGALLLFFALPCLLVVFGLCFLPRTVLFKALFGLWWFKPLFDRVILHVIAVRFFDPEAPLPRLFRGLGKSLRSGLAGDLLWRRFSPWRGGRMPVRVLEKLTGRTARKRIAMLESGGLGFCLMVTILGIALNYTLLAGEFLFTVIVLSMLDLGSFDEVFKDYATFFTVLSVVVNGINFLVVESLYICMNFGIYINSRLETEGWDLQLDFKRFAGKNDANPAPDAARSGGPGKTPNPALSGIAGIVVLGALLLGPGIQPLYSETASDVQDIAGTSAEASFQNSADAPLTGEEEALKQLDEVLASPDFGGEKKSWRIQPRESGEKTEEQNPLFDAFPSFGNVKQIFGLFLRALLFAGIAALMGFGLYRYLKTGGFIKKNRGWKSSALAKAEKEKNSSLLLEGAKELWRRGLVREAWAQCFAAILAAFSERDNFTFPRDATEYGCLKLLKARNTPEAESFSVFLRSWIAMAYGGRIPDSNYFEAALAFCASIQGGANG